ncbi:MAG: RNA polymerase subunit sigma-24 [Flavobacteriales bacterium]|nr:sigma-70 family RNA polymerase sigma factor [Flavobacteriaceae bacterium]PHX92236.1 MAG: RNA polymerase subunit sigma-24 [Flavobacteriales bacterium]
MTEKELVDGCIREDRICQRELWDRYSKKLMSLCIRYCNNQEEAEDALMEAYIKIYDNLNKFKFLSSLETWMRRVTVNLCINKIRARKHIWNSISDDEYRIGFNDNTFENLQVQQILKLVESLPVGYRTIFNLYAIEGYPHKEIAKILAIDEGTSRSQFSKARKALQLSIEKLEGGVMPS